MAQPPRIFDRALHARRLRRAARGPNEADFLAVRVAEDIAERLAAINRRFDIGVALGARAGALRRALAPGKVGWLVEAGVAGPGLVVDEERLPFAPASLDLVVSALALHWVDDLVGTLIQIRRALRPDGLFIGAMLGGATLTELRASLLGAEIAARGGAGPRVSPFVDAADGAALMQRAGFALPVIDADAVAVRYAHPLELIADLRAMGETSALIDRPAAALTRGIVQAMCALYVERFGAPDGRVAATFEIITLTGWAPAESQPQPLPRGSATTRLADALRGEERS